MTINDAIIVLERHALTCCEIRNDLKGYAEVQQAAKVIRDQLSKEVGECRHNQIETA